MQKKISKQTSLDLAMPVEDEHGNMRNAVAPKMKLTVMLHNADHPKRPLGLIATDLEHLTRILKFQVEEKGMVVTGLINIIPEENEELT